MSFLFVLTMLCWRDGHLEQRTVHGAKLRGGCQQGRRGSWALDHWPHMWGLEQQTGHQCRVHLRRHCASRSCPHFHHTLLGGLQKCQLSSRGMCYLRLDSLYQRLESQVAPGGQGVPLQQFLTMLLPRRRAVEMLGLGLRWYRLMQQKAVCKRNM